MIELADAVVVVNVADPTDVGLVELADLGVEVEETTDVGVGGDMAEPVNEELGIVELVDAVKLEDMGKHKKSS